MAHGPARVERRTISKKVLRTLQQCRCEHQRPAHRGNRIVHSSCVAGSRTRSAKVLWNL